ncbi:MAG: hypothetical protein H7Y38_04730 [Armatimonadetes bacterium]|nr:hypothetical protein [Armatimonadota bacterium]
MDKEEFKQRVREAFGEDLHRASPATVREFFDSIDVVVPLTLRGDSRIVIEETAKTYEEVMRTFFARILHEPSDRAAQLLFVVALDLCYSVIESHDADRIGHLFRHWDDDPS